MGFVVTRNVIPAAIAAMPRKVEMAVAKSAHDMLRDAKSRAAVDTGAMRASGFAHSAGAFTWMVGFSASYTLFVELGTRYMRAQPFIVPAWVAARYRLMQALSRLDLLLG